MLGGGFVGKEGGGCRVLTSNISLGGISVGRRLVGIGRGSGTGKFKRKKEGEGKGAKNQRGGVKKKGKTIPSA